MKYLGRRFVFALAVALVTLGVVSLTFANAETVNTNASVSREAYFTYPITQTAPPRDAQRLSPRDGLPGGRTRRGPPGLRLRSATSRRPARPHRRPAHPDHPDGDLAQPMPCPARPPSACSAASRATCRWPAFTLPPLAGRTALTASSSSCCTPNGVELRGRVAGAARPRVATRRPARGRGPAEVSDADHHCADRRGPLATQTITGIEACPVTSALERRTRPRARRSTAHVCPTSTASPAPLRCSRATAPLDVRSHVRRPRLDRRR